MFELRTYTSGKGRVFGTTTGHYTYTYFDPMYRLILLRGIAWSLREDPAPFMALVFHGITNEQGLVDTTETMMNYRNRKKIKFKKKRRTDVLARIFQRNQRTNPDCYRFVCVYGCMQ